MKFKNTALVSVLLGLGLSVSAYAHEGHQHKHQEGEVCACEEHDHMKGESHEHMMGETHDHMMGQSHDHMKGEMEKYMGPKGTDSVQFSNCRIRLNVEGRPSALFVDVTNEDAKEVAHLVDFKVPGFNRVELHESFTDEQGVHHMIHRPVIDIQSQKTLALKPGSFHGMLYESDNTLKTGDMVKATFIFATEGQKEVECKVGDITTQ